MSDLSFDHVLSNQYTVFDGLAGMHVEDIYQDRQGFLWIAFGYSGSEVLIGRYDPRDQQVACINVGKGDEGVAQSGTRHVRTDERGWPGTDLE